MYESHNLLFIGNGMAIKWGYYQTAVMKNYNYVLHVHVFAWPLLMNFCILDNVLGDFLKVCLELKLHRI